MFLPAVRPSCHLLRLVGSLLFAKVVMFVMEP